MRTLGFKGLLVLTILVGTVVPQFHEKCTFGNNIKGFIKCATLKTLGTLAQAQSEDSFVIVPGITLKRDLTSKRSARDLKMDSIDSTGSTSKLVEKLLSASSNFISSRMLQIEIPMNVSSTDMARAFEEGRGKIKKIMGPMILGFGSKMMSMVPVMFTGLAFLTTKALIVGKLALLVSVILFLQTFFSGRILSHGGSYGIGFPPNYGVGIPPIYGAGIPPTYGVPSTSYGTNFGTNSLGGWGGSGQPSYARSINTSPQEEEVESNQNI